MEEKGTKTIRTYAKTWEFDYVVYGYGDFTLPFPLKLTQVGIFVCVLLLVNIVILPIPAHVPWLFRLAGSAGITHLITNLDIDGKKPYIWIPKQVIYLVGQPKQWNKFRPIKKTESFSFNDMKDIKIR